MRNENKERAQQIHSFQICKAVLYCDVTSEAHQIVLLLTNGNKMSFLFRKSWALVMRQMFLFDFRNVIF